MGLNRENARVSSRRLIWIPSSVMMCSGSNWWDKFIPGMLKPEVSKIDKLLDLVTTMNTTLSTGQAKLEAGQSKLEAGQSKLEAGQSRLEAGQLVLERKVGSLIETSVRSLGSKKFGESFVIGHIAGGVDQLVYLVSLGNHLKLSIEKLDERIAASNAVVDALKPSISPLVKKLRDFIIIHDIVSSPNEEDSKLSASDAIEAGDLQKGVGIMIGMSRRLGMEQWRKFLDRLKPALTIDDEKLRKILRAGDGPGVLLANVMWRSELWKERHQYKGADYVEKYLMEVEDPFREFEDEAEFDMRGSISFVGPSLTIQVGEIKSSLNDLPKAKRQLANRLQLLRWTTTVVFSTNFTSILIGHVVIPRSSGEADRPPTIDAAGIQFEVHVL